MKNYCPKQYNNISFSEEFFRKGKKKIEKEEFEEKELGTIYHYTFKAFMYYLQKLSTKSTILGLDTVSEASKYYQVSVQTIYEWLKKDGLAPPKSEVFYVSLSKKNEILKTVEELKKENQELKDALSKLTLKNMCLEELVNAANDDLGIDIKKKFESRQSKKSKTKTKKRG